MTALCFSSDHPETSAWQITRPGTYGADLVFGTDTPYPVPSVAVTLTVNPPDTHTTAARPAR